ncbi:unnamed protein product [Chrysoparadoxa australica]
MAFIVGYIPGSIIVIEQLGKVKDLLRMAVELTIVLVWAGSMACLYVAYLIVTDILHLPRSSLAHLAAVLGIVGIALCSLIMPFASRSEAHVIPTQEDHKEYQKQFSSSRDICKIPEMAPILRNVVDKALCFESLDFVIAVEQFEAESFTSVEEQHSALVHLIDTFIKEDSEYEVNISDRLRALVLPFRSLQAYQVLSEDERSLILEPQCEEVADMIDDNLLRCFYRHPDFLPTAKRLQDMENSYERELHFIQDVIGDEP